MAGPVPASANRGDARPPKEPSAIYKLVMTPLILVSFLVSLALVDLRYSALRAHYHADTDQASRLPRWLHRIVDRYRPYRYVTVDERGRPVGEGRPRSPGSPGREAEDYYHSKQRKLMKMEAAEAFEIRGSVLVALALLSLGVSWAAWRLAAWSFGIVMAWLS